MHSILTLLFLGDADRRCKGCGRAWRSGVLCPDCMHAQSARLALTQLQIAREERAATALWMLCGIRCERAVQAEGWIVSLWRVSIPGGQPETTLIHGPTLIVMAEKRLPDVAALRDPKDVLGGNNDS